MYRLFFRFIAVFAVFLAPQWALANDAITGVPFTLTSSVADVQKALGLSKPPQPMRAHPPLTQGDSMLWAKEKGIRAFFHADGRIYVIRLDPPFDGSVGGMKLGQARSSLIQTLGAPKRMVKSPPGAPDGYLYDVAPGVAARFDFDKADNIDKIMLFAADNR